MTSSKLGALALLAASAPAAAFAQPSGPTDQNRADRLAAPPVRPAAPPAGAPRGAQAIEVQAEPAAATLRSVEVSGSTLPPALFAAAMRPFVGQPLSRATVTAAAEAASRVYADSDIALYTIQAPQQDLASGVLRLQAIEGFVQQVALHGDVKARQLTLAKAYAQPLSSQRPLRRSTLERYLSLIRDTPGLKVEPSFLKGSQVGGVVLALGLDGRRTDLNLSLTTRGAAALGHVQLQADLTAYSLLRSGDSTKLTAAIPSDPKRFQYVALAHTQPLGADGLQLAASVGHLRTRPKGSTSAGDATLGSVGLSYPVIRGYEKNLYLTASFDGIDSSNAVLGSVLATERTHTARAAAAFTLGKPTYSLQASAAASRGATKLGGSTPPGAADDNFSKLNARLGLDRAFGRQVVVRAKAVGQFTGDRLPASELFSLGGDDFGRAFDQSTVIGDRGRAASLELAWRPAKTPRDLAGSELYGFVDGGRVVVRPRFGLPQAHADLASTGLGVRVGWKQNTAVGIEGAYALDAPTPSLNHAWKLGVSFRTLR